MSGRRDERDGQHQLQLFLAAETMRIRAETAEKKKLISFHLGDCCGWGVGTDERHDE
jgi:hypothetical protein